MSALDHCLSVAGGARTTATREYLHGEHSANYFDDGVQYLTDGREKYIWYTQTGREQLFDLRDDPDELHDVAAYSTSTGAGDRNRIEFWRHCMIDELGKRPQDGLSDGTQLIPGKLLSAVRPELLREQPTKA